MEPPLTLITFGDRIKLTDDDDKTVMMANNTKKDVEELIRFRDTINACAIFENPQDDIHALMVEASSPDKKKDWRNEFAKEAMTKVHDDSWQEMAKKSFEYADAMMAEAEKRKA